MDDQTLIQALRPLALRDSFQCLGCGHEHGCSIHGCAIIKRAVERLEQLTALPRNAPLTLEELREMDREPVYVRSGDGSQGWAFVCVMFDQVHIHSPCPFFDGFNPNCINMESDDPDAHFGLHEMGWRAYRRKPEKGEK